MSTILDLKVIKADAALARNDPIKLSDNSQFIINSYDSLHIIEPRLPSYHKAIGETTTFKFLNTKELYSVNRLLHSESIKNLPVNKFNNVIFKDGDEFLNFTAQIPSIVQSQWSPININTRDCLLGVLFNSGELLVMGRESLDFGDYKVRINVFERLIKLYDEIIECEGQYYVSAEVFKHLKLKYFAFNMLDNKLHLAIVDMTNRIIIFDDKMNVFKQIDYSKDIAKIKWEKGVFLIIGQDNSLSVFNEALEQTKELIESGRFVNQRNEIIKVGDKTYLVSTFTSKLVIFDGDETFEYSIKNWYSNTSIILGIQENLLTILLSYENGMFKTLQFDLITKKFTPIPNDISMSLFTEGVIMSFQNATEREELSLEENIIIHGMNAISDEIFAITYKVLPKNSIHYRSDADLSVNVAFIKLSSPIGKIKVDSVTNTSISKLVTYYLHNFEKIPVLIEDLSSSKHEIFEFFLKNFQEFVNLNLKELPQLNRITIDTSLNLNQILIENFLNQNQVIELQYLQTFATLLSNTLEGYISTSDDAKSLYDKIKQYKFDMKSIVTQYLKNLLLEAYNNKIIKDEADKFFLITSYQQLSSTSVYSNIPTQTSLTINVHDSEEKFEINSLTKLENQSQLDENTRMISSTSNHKWITCNLTNYPLTKLNNKIDESNQFKYLSFNTEFNDKTEEEKDKMIIKEVFESLGFCYISGNRIYDVS
ncbi:hypothetical protein KGF54_005078 [Candida jiufengensis]|uniref:uncharacterized protein n=1 Tax=Candida jiufengensis TaxID=497108 RepID=UPI002224CCB9|nr:uncharacterized protein KGF54_005078 [Candida jiufengensis]KAI5952003.1 hypothetical protein KGF54_005078 [Candida jiufengensis]